MVLISQGDVEQFGEVLLADEIVWHYLMSFTHVTGVREGDHLDVVMADAMRFGDDGRVVEFWTLSIDQEAVDSLHRLALQRRPLEGHPTIGSWDLWLYLALRSSGTKGVNQ
jgi:hypothetical protein